MRDYRHSFVTITAGPHAKIHHYYDWLHTDDSPGTTSCEQTRLHHHPIVQRLADYTESLTTGVGTASLRDALDRLDPDPERLCRRCFNPVKVIAPYVERRAARHHRNGETQ